MVRKVIVSIGDVYVFREPTILQTVLGSCVSVCLWDERLKIGGMNHFLMPCMENDLKSPAYSGQKSIDRLVSNIINAGARMGHLKAKVFGGGRVIKEFSQRLDVGKDNIEMAKKMLGGFGIPIVKECTGYDTGIKVVFYTATGRAFVKRLEEVPD